MALLHDDRWLYVSLTSTCRDPVVTAAFKYPKFVKGLRRQFLQMFDVNGDGELDREELTHFIAAHVKMAFKAGLMPTQEFFDDGSLEIGQIESLLETRCKDMLKGYFSMDKDADGT